MIYQSVFVSPIGKLQLFANHHALVAINLEKAKYPFEKTNVFLSLKTNLQQETNPILEQFKTELSHYFDGKLTRFTTPIVLLGSPFQIKVWQSLQQMPYGKTFSYREQAIAIEQPTAVRAVANANSRNHLPIIIPCHRVIGSNGKLTGFAGGLDVKQFLLDLENKMKI